MPLMLDQNEHPLNMTADTAPIVVSGEERCWFCDAHERGAALSLSQAEIMMRRMSASAREASYDALMGHKPHVTPPTRSMGGRYFPTFAPLSVIEIGLAMFAAAGAIGFVLISAAAITGWSIWLVSQGVVLTLALGVLCPRCWHWLYRLRLPRIATVCDGHDYVSQFFDGKAHERAVFVGIGRDMRIAHEIVVEGSRTAVYFDMRQILADMLKNDAVLLLIFHNHPTGSSQPSRPDRVFTEVLRKSCRAIGMALVDHLIIGREDRYSFRMEQQL